MQSRDDRKPYCSERMKLCQKHLAKVYGRSKSIFLRARGGEETSVVYPASVISSDEDSHSRISSQRSTGKCTTKVSPYLSAVSGLFDGPTLLKRLHLRSFQSSVANSSPKASCSKFCKDDEHNTSSVPIFFEKLPLSHSVSHPAPSWASSSETVGQPWTTSDNSRTTTGTFKKDGVPQIEQREKDVGLLRACCSQGNVGGDTGGPCGRIQQSEMDSGVLTSRLGTLPEEILSFELKAMDGQPQLGPSIVPTKQKVDGSGRCRVVESDAEPLGVYYSGASQPVVRQYQQLRSDAYHTLGLPPKDSRLHCEGDIGWYSEEAVPDKPSRRLEYKAGLCSSDDSAGAHSTVERTGSCFTRNPRALSCISNLTPIRTREARGNYGADEDSSLFKPLLQYSYQPAGQSGDTCENSVVQGRQAKCPTDLCLAPAETHGSGELRSTHLTESTAPGKDALRCEPTPNTSVKDSVNREVQAVNASCNNPAHLARVTKTNMKRLERSSNRLWKYGSMALCTENPVRDYTTGSPQDFRIKHIDRKVSWSRSGNRKLVNHVCQILKQHRWGPVTVETLDDLKGRLNSHCVNAVIQQMRDPSLALRFFKWAKLREGYQHDVYTYTTMINILGRARNLSGVRYLLEEMHKDGCEPTVVTYNTLILTYGKVKSLSESLRIFRIMKEAGCQPDNITFSILIHLCVKSGFLQEALKLYHGMLEAGIQPDTITYSIVIDSLGKAGNLNEARRLFREMKEKGCVPNEFTYNSLIDRHAKSRQTKYALRYYQEMRNSGFPLNPVVCTTMMSVLASLGQFAEAEGLFSEMQQAGITGDTAAYSLMINMWGQARNLDKAVSWYGKMLGCMLTPSLSVFTALVNAHLDLHLYEGAQHFLTSMAMWGVSPDLKVYTSLLRHCTGCERQDHVDAVLGLMDRLGHPAHKFVFDLLTAKDQDRKHTRIRVEKFFDSVQHEDQDGKRAFANALIEFLHKLQCKTDPGFVWELALEKGLFPSAIIRREAPDHWLIDLHSMSVGTALVALPRLLLILRDNWVEAPTKRVYLVTGWGKRSRVTGSSTMKQSVNDLLQAAKSPFSIDHTNAGVFVSYGVPFCDWISVPSNRRRLGLHVAT